MDGMKMFRVYNRCGYDIGVTLTNGQKPIIRAGSFLPLTVNDILYLESIARSKKKPFSSKELVVVSDDGKDLTLEDLGGYTDSYSEKHYGEGEIISNLKKSAKQIESWLEGIEDQIELHAILDKAKEMDLSTSKMKVILAKLPEANVFDESINGGCQYVKYNKISRLAKRTDGVARNSSSINPEKLY